jgi:hypothetical protein
MGTFSNVYLGEMDQAKFDQYTKEGINLFKENKFAIKEISNDTL